MLKLFLWLKYLRRKKIVLLSISAVALSCALLIVVASLFTGFINVFEASAVETMGDIVITPPVKFERYPLLVERLEQIAGVERATARLSAKGLLHLGRGSVRAVEIWGIEPAGRAEVTGFKKSLIKQKGVSGDVTFEVADSPEKIGGFLGIGLVTEPDEKTDEYDLAAVENIIGSQVVLTTASAAEAGDERAGMRPKRRTIAFTVVDAVFTGIYGFDKSFVYLPIEQLQEKLYPGRGEKIADQIQIKVANSEQAEILLSQITAIWQGFAAEELAWPAYLVRETTIATAREMQSLDVAELRKQMGVLLVIFGVISLSVVLLILCIFYMIVETKRKDIAIIKSCGCSSGSVAAIFIGFGACVGAIGSAFGTFLGYIVITNINTIEDWIRIIFGLKLWKSSVYMFSKIPNQVDWEAVVPIVLAAVAAAAVGALIPAIAAVRVKPVNILRYE